MRTRGESQPTTKVDIDALVPPALQLLGQSAYVQLCVFDSLSRCAAVAPRLVAKQDLSRAAARALAKHDSLAVEIRRHGAEPAEAMEPFVPALDAFRQMTQGATWYEAMLGCYLTTGMLDDFFASLAGGLPNDVRHRIVPILDGDAEAPLMVREITAGIAADPTLSSSLALWGRRLVGDTLLIARSALHVSGDLARDESRLEPVFTEIIAAHTRRMDELGLTA